MSFPEARFLEISILFLSWSSRYPVKEDTAGSVWLELFPHRYNRIIPDPKALAVDYSDCSDCGDYGECVD